MDYIKFKEEWDKFNAWTGTEYDKFLKEPVKGDDRVNSPSHYTAGKVEAIEIIEDAIANAPNPGLGMLQAQVLKYLLRMWLKDNPLEDAKKAQWYLNRLVEKGQSAR